MTQPLKEKVLATSTKFKFYGRCLLHVAFGYSVTVLVAWLSQGLQVAGMVGLITVTLGVWSAAGTGAWLVGYFTERWLQLGAATFLIAAPFGIACGPLMGAANAEQLWQWLASLGAVLLVACVVGLLLPVDAHRFLRWYLVGPPLMATVVTLLDTVDQDVPGLLYAIGALLLVACTVGDANRAKSSLYADPRKAHRLGALLWLDSVNVVRHFWIVFMKD